MLTRSRSRSSDTPDSTCNGEDSQNSTVRPNSPSQSLSQSDSAPKEDYVPRKKKRKKTGSRRGRHRKQDQWVCMMPEAFRSSSGEETAEGCRACSSIISLKDPNSNTSRRYLFKEISSEPHSGQICEILKFTDEPRSWFIENTIQTDGSLFLCTPVDPLFLVLPYFQEAAKTGKYTTLDVILEDGQYHDAYRVLSSCIHPAQWANICNLKTVGDTSVYRLNKDRTLDWLQKKVSILAEELEREKVYVGSGSRSSAMAGSKQLEITQSSFSSYACGMINDYLNGDLAQELSKIYNVAITEKTSAKLTSEERRENGSSEPPTKKICLSDNSEPLEDYSRSNGSLLPPVKVPELTASQKSLAKIDKKGMKPLSSFFKKR